MKKIAVLLGVVFLAASGFAWYEATHWYITNDYTIRFTSKDPTGIFTDLKGDIFFDENDLPASRFEVTVDVNSINTGNKLKNKHARSAKWFDAEKYPQIKFKSSWVHRSDSAFIVTGLLDMHGVQKFISFPFQYTQTDSGAVFIAGFDVNRNDYHIGKPGHGVADTLHVDLKVPVKK